MAGKGFSIVGRVVRRASVFTAAIVLTLVAASHAWATDPPPLTLPETGVDLPGFIELAVTAMGAVAAVAVGGFVAFLVVRKGLGWIRRAV